MGAADFIGTTLLSLGARATSGPINTIVTNVPGPQVPLYMLGARLEAMYPQVPLLQQMGLGIALMSYDGKLCWGFNGDYEMMPDMKDLVAHVEEDFAELQAAVGLRVVGSDEQPILAGEPAPNDRKNADPAPSGRG